MGHVGGKAAGILNLGEIALALSSAEGWLEAQF